MKIKDLQKAKENYELIQSLDREIIRVEKLAQKVAGGRFKTTLSLELEDTEPGEKVGFNEDGDIVFNQEQAEGAVFGRLFLNTMYGACNSTPKKESENTETFEVNEVAVLEVLGVLIFRLTTERKRLVNELRKFGIE